MYYGRRVATKELAERVASITNEQIEKVAQKILKNQQVNIDDINEQKMHVCIWGNVNKVSFLKKK